MNVGIVGLGRMGKGIAARLIRAGHRVVGYDVHPGERARARELHIEWVDSLAMVPNVIGEPRFMIVMVPPGRHVDEAIDAVAPGLAPGDIVIDGGNSFYEDSIARGERLRKMGVGFLDMGVSGGIWGEQEGYCLMLGGSRDAYDRSEPILRDLAVDGGCAYVGPLGAGHYAKMIHNGIEYGMLQAYGEGFEILRRSPYDYDLGALAELWNHGGVIRSWLLELAESAFEKSPDLEHVKGWVADSGEGRWTVDEAVARAVPAPVIALALMMRFRSRQDDSFSGKFVAALRHEFGGHEVKQE